MMPLFRPIATAAVVMFCATVARSQTLTPFLLQDVNSATEAHTQQILLENAPAGYDDVFYISEGPTPGLWHTGSGDVGDFFVSDAYVAQTIGSLTFFWGYGVPVTLHVADGSTGATRTVGQFPNFYGGAPCGTKICFSTGNNLVGVSDGTAAGTAIIASTEPAVTDSVFPREFASTGKSVYFSGFDLAHGECVSGNGNTFCGELWTSDGTAAGTSLVSDIVPGPFPSSPEGLVAWNGKIYFNAFGSEADVNRYFYVSDGTKAGTRPLTKLATVARGGFGGGAIVGAGKYVYLLSSGLFLNGAHDSQYQWWRTEGTPESTVLVRDLVNSANPELNALTLDLIASPQAILFTVRRTLSSSATSMELWSYDGTRATKLRDLPPLGMSLLGYSPAVQGFYYAVQENGDDGETLYETDGSSAGKLVLLLPGVSGCVAFSAGEHVAHFDVYKGGDYREKWQTDGTANGTHPIHNETLFGASSYPDLLTSLANRLYFFASDGRSPKKLFVSDGIGPATAVSPMITCDSAGYCAQPVLRDGQVYVVQSSEWWTVDDSGRASPLSQSFALDQNRPMTVPVRLGSASYLIASTATGPQLFKRDSSGTSVVTSISAPLLSRPIELVSTATHLFLSDGTSLWTSDGTAEGTGQLVDGFIFGLQSSDTGVYFEHPVNGTYQLWFSDGTASGTVQVATANNLTSSFLLSYVWHDMLFFADSGRFWRTKPGKDGTVELPRGAGDPTFADLGDQAAIIWSDIGSRTCQVWLTDGTKDGTKLQFTIDQASNVLPPITMGNGDVYLPVQRGLPMFLNLRTGRRVEFSGILVPAFGGQGSVVGVGTRAIFAAGTDRMGREVWAIDLADNTRPRAPLASVAFAGITSLHGQRHAVFGITVTGESPEASAVHFETVDGTLRGTPDYTATAGVLSIPTGQSKRSVVVPVGDAGGTFSLILTQPDNAEIAVGLATADIPPAAMRRHPSQH